MKSQLIPLFNFPAGVMPKGKAGYLSVIAAKDEADEPAEILIHGSIGFSFWGDGVTGKEFTDALNGIAKGTKIIVGVNSQGGEVGEGLAIFNAIQRRSADITVRIDGYALSIASFFPLAASEVLTPESALWMIHNVWTGAQGNAGDMRKAADMLDKHDDVLVAEYARHTGKSEDAIRAAMEEETWLTGKEAIEWGLADKLSDNEPALDVLDFSGMQNSTFKKIPSNCRAIILAAAKGEQSNTLPKGKQPITSAADDSTAPKGGQQKNQTEGQIMKRTQMLALLKKWGVKVDDSTTDEQLAALVEAGPPQATPQPPNVIDVQKEIKDSVAKAKAEMRREADARTELGKLVGEKRITQAQADRSLPTILEESGELKDSAVLATLRENPVMPEPATPVAAEPSITADASGVDTVKAMARFNEPVKAFMRGASIDMKIIGRASMARAQFFKKHMAKIRETVMNAGVNTIDATLQRDVILQTIITDFARRVLPLTAFSTVFQNVPLEGTNKVQVPFLDLDASASTSFKHADGYVAGDTSIDNREIQVGKRADADVLDDTKQYDRKYQGLQFTSEEFARQPYLKLEELARLKAEKLASDIVAHVLSIITAANYGAAAVAKAAALFTPDDVADLVGACKTWPESGRSLILDTDYHVALLKNSGIKGALEYGGAEAIREGRIPILYGFNYREINTIPANGENLKGFAVFMSAILFAAAPVAPAEEVRRDGTVYSVVTDPLTGISLEYRNFGNSPMDYAGHFIESSYGFEKGNGNALKRITT